jgi:hypothetical protein
LLNQLQRLHPEANLPNLSTLLDPQPAEGLPLAAIMFTFFFQFQPAINLIYNAQQ